MSSREKILQVVQLNQPAAHPLPVLEHIAAIEYADNTAQFIQVLESIGGKVVVIHSEAAVAGYIQQHFTAGTNYITTIASVKDITQLDAAVDAHVLENIEVALVPGGIGVAENGSVWVTEREIKIRALPFICQHLCILLPQKNIVSNMHQAYNSISNAKYDFGVFIAGPSKTADIEQSLVLGAHGPKTLTIFLTQ